MHWHAIIQRRPSRRALQAFVRIIEHKSGTEASNLASEAGEAHGIQHFVKILVSQGGERRDFGRKEIIHLSNFRALRSFGVPFLFANIAILKYAWSTMPINGEHPLKLRFTYGGWVNPQTVEWCDGILISRDLFDSNLSSATKVSPSNEDWRQFWSAVDAIKVWEWLPEYDNELVLDGLQWSLKLEHNGRKISCKGSNAFPGFVGPEFPDTCDFAKFLDAIQILARRKFE